MTAFKQKIHGIGLAIVVLVFVVFFTFNLRVEFPLEQRARMQASSQNYQVFARVNRGYFENRMLPMHGYHFLCWERGRAAFMALLQTPVNDETIQQQLQSLGAVAGDNLSQETFSERADAQAEAPRRRVKGSRIHINLITSKGRKYAISELIRAKKLGPIDIRLGGHLQFRPSWLSGCVICLVSCPGGRLSNATFTMRDYYQGRAAYSLTSLGKRVLLDKEQVIVEFIVLKD